MQLEAYFDFLAENDIRLKGTHVGIETVLYQYIHRCQTAEEIEKNYSGLTLEQVYATILYYLHNHEAVSQYLQNWLEHCFQAEQQQDRNPSPAVQRLLQLKSERKSAISSGQLPGHEIPA